VTGLDGALVLDLPPEESKEYKTLMDEKGLATVFLVSPITPENRLELIAQRASGFIYYVSQMGVTGERSKTSSTIPDMIRKIRARSIVPIVVGFGISSPEHVSDVAKYADGVVVGSAIVRRIGKLGGEPGFEREIGEFVGTLTAPLRKE
jgi:tryptophan synthase alpha chain